MAIYILLYSRFFPKHFIRMHTQKIVPLRKQNAVFFLIQGHFAYKMETMNETGSWWSELIFIFSAQSQCQISVCLEKHLTVKSV